MSPNTKRSRAHGTQDPAPHRSSQTMAIFRARLEAGDYDAIIGRKLRRGLRQAAADTGLDAEIGALRLALIRLLQEESDPSRLAAGVSRIAGIAVQAARLRQSPDSEFDAIRLQVQVALDAYEAEEAANATPQSHQPWTDPAPWKVEDQMIP